MTIQKMNRGASKNVVEYEKIVFRGLIMLLPYYECPSFNICNCNLCPLDPYVDEKIGLKDDEKCRAQKPTRMKIGSKYPGLLKYQGLTGKEWAGFSRWSGLSEEEKKKVKDRLNRNLLQKRKQK